VRTNSPCTTIWRSDWTRMLCQHLHLSIMVELIMFLVQSTRRLAEVPVAWSPTGAGMRLALTSDAPLGPTNPVALCVTAAAAPAGADCEAALAGVANGGFWGISVQPQAEYHVSLYLKRGPEGPSEVSCVLGYQSRLRAALEAVLASSADGS